MKNILILAIMIVSIQSTMAQKKFLTSDNKSVTNSAPAEALFIHANANVFVVGETLYYKIYCLNSTNNKPSQISKIAYVELIDSNKEIIFLNKINLENALGQGDFFVPTTITTGNYKLIAYTNWMLNNTESNLFQIELNIINPYKSLETENILNIDSSSIAELKKKKQTTFSTLNINNTISLELEKKNYSKREKVFLKLKKTVPNSDNGNYSISIRKIDSLPINQKLGANEFINSLAGRSKNILLNDSLFLPELRGELITGKIISKSKSLNNINGKTIALSIPGAPFTTKIVKTNQLGKFTFIIDKIPNYSNVVVQVLENDSNEYGLILDKPNEIDLSKLTFQNELKLNPTYKNAIEARSIASQIENAYYHIKKDSLDTTSNSNPFFHALEKNYILDDYTRFPSFKETIIEVITEMYIEQKNEIYSLHLRTNNFYKEDLAEPSLVLVDGLIIQNINELFEYKTKNIYKISIVPGAYFYGPRLFNGVISIVTKNNDYTTKTKGDYYLKSEILRPLNDKNYYNPDYSKNLKLNTIPDYRYQLLWLPNINFEDEEKLIDLYTSDLPGKFEVSIEGFSESGIPFSTKDYFEVQ